ncbi:Protein STRUBBELIG-RECEPTOR FAMILY 7 [Striga hermonthica]|uniref:Protein STRUBBELIG-RECEPTOR FAMILY 7 n=1 Tax=Striga hermonthica TaxID=68872 RepID=A0A9N7MD26_STRHE|nr:Protein STRUBBELIG-RECEPTOR FAMILY 7 [Striga hermonthica]
MAIAYSGYIAPEHNQPGNGNIQADVYAFGVLLLELLTARKPFDYLKPTAEQYLVRWVSSKLHESSSLAKMVDPTIARTISSKSLSYFGDIIYLCIQVFSLKPTAEQYLVRWASSKLYDSSSLAKMVDPTIARTISSKSLSYFGDIISLCIQIFRYSHRSLSPPIAHGNIKAANILLDEYLMPHVCDYGQAILRPLACNSFKIKVIS